MVRMICFLAFVLLANVSTAEERFQFASEAQRIMYLELVTELRCPKCQNQNIADSNAMISEDMKRKTWELVTEGHSKQEVIDFMKQRYGEFVHYQPPMTPVTIWLYLLPVIFIFLMAFIVVRSKRNSARTTDAAGIEKAEKALKDM